MREVLFIALALACPLMMIFMMRGHGHGSSASGHGSCHSGHEDESVSTLNAEELRWRRDELDRLITEQEEAERRSAVETSAGHR